MDGVLAKAASENFPVMPGFLPARLRADLAAIYGYARFVDDIGDEKLVDDIGDEKLVDHTGDEARVDSADRLAMLDVVDAELTTLFAGGDPDLPPLRALVEPVRAGRMPETPLRRLVQANRLDQQVDRYETFEDLRHYCTLSADPVGRLVLAAIGLDTADRIALSDRVCTGLQLVEHWQDVAEDRARGRVYLPQEDLRRFGVGDEDLRAAHAGAALKALLAFEVSRARALLAAGPPLVARVPGRAKLAIAGFVAGGRAALHAIEAVDFDVLPGAPKPTRPRQLREGIAVLSASRFPSVVAK